MGMSASQVRFLSLQHRKNDIGRELTTLSNRKMGLSRDMNRVSKNYTDALNKTVLRWSNDCGNSYNMMNYDMLMKPNDINCETPYILTDSQGRVVVDDTKIWFDKETSQLLVGSDVPAGKGVTYRQLAAAISAYSGVDTHTNDLTFFNNNALGIDSHTLGSFNHATYTTTAVFGSSSADGCQYEVVKGIEDYDYDNSLRYDLMTQLGILTKTEQTQFNSILDELYGTQNGIDFEGGYEALLQKYDDDHNYLLNGKDGYDKFFGKITNSTGVLSLDGGCAMGNLALAKAYKEEYQAYLNTEIKHSVNHDRPNEKIADSSASSIYTMDNKNTHVVATYKYDKASQTGVSNRILGLNTFLGSGSDLQTSKSGSQYNINIKGILNNLKFYTADGLVHSSFISAFSNYGNHNGAGISTDGYSDKAWNVFANTRGDDPTWAYQNSLWYSNSGLSGLHINQVTSWSQLYNPNAGQEFNNDAKVSITGYTWGENRPYGNDISQIWDALEVSNNLSNGSVSTKGSGGWFEMLKESFLKGTQADAGAVEYAYQRMCDLYKDGIKDNTEHSNGDHTGSVTRKRAASESNDHFGVGWCNEFGTSDDGVAISSTNAIAAFVTFYEMYMAVNGDTSRIANGATQTEVFKAGVTDCLGKYDTSIARNVYNNTNIINQEYTNWTDRCSAASTNGAYTDYTYTAPSNSASTTSQTVTFKYTYKKGGVTFTETAKVTGIWNGTSMSNITKIETTSQTSGSSEGSTYEQTTISKSGDTYTVSNNNGSRTITTTYEKVGSQVQSKISGSFGDGITSMEVVYQSDGKVSIQKINGNTNMSAFKELGQQYIILAKDTASPTIDPEYDDKYKITPRSVGTCTISETLTMKPEDEFSSQLDDLVTTWTQKVEKLKEDLDKAFAGLETKFMDYFDVLFKRISENGWVYDEKVNNPTNQKASTTYLNTMLQNNKYYLTEAKELTGDAKYQYTMKLAEDVSKVYEIHDTNAENQALAEYETAKTMIAMKEKKIDARMAKLETEQQVINTELDSIEKVRNDNIEKYFKIFA